VFNWFGISASTRRDHVSFRAAVSAPATAAKTAAATLLAAVVSAHAAAPLIGDVPDQVIAQNTSTVTNYFTIGDAETPFSALVVTATSSNTGLVPNSPANLILGGTTAAHHQGHARGRTNGRDNHHAHGDGRRIAHGQQHVQPPRHCAEYRADVERVAGISNRRAGSDAGDFIHRQ
jgi:hypothetical protein